MRIFNFKIKDFEKEFNAPEGLFVSEKAIIDNEITNDLSPDWNYEKADILCTAVLHNSEITVYLREEQDTRPIKNALKEYLRKDKQYHAFNRNMEHGNFKGFVDLDLNIKEIKPFKAKGWNKDKFFEELMRNEVIPKVNIFDPFNGDGSKCIDAWNKYKYHKDPQILMDCVLHCVQCVCKEAVILKHKQFFEDNWNIDNNGFMLERK